MPTSSTRTARLTTTQPETVVLVPGLGLDAREWEGVRAGLRAHSVVVCVPAMGTRAASGTDLHVERQAERVLSELDVVVGDVILVGHSASCPVVVEVARRTGRVVGLVLVGPVTDPAVSTWPRIAASWLRTATHERLWEVPLVAPQYRAVGVGSMLRSMNRSRTYRTDLALAGVRARTRIVRGDHDRIAGARWCAELARVSGGSVVTAPRSAHMVPITHPMLVAAAVEACRRSGEGVSRDLAG